jgi:hypothetical protein
MVIKLGDVRQYREVVPGRSPSSKFELAVGDTKAEFSAAKPTGNLSVEGQLEAKAKIDQYVEDKDIRADSRYVGFGYSNDYYAKTLGVAPGDVSLTFNADNNPYVGAMFSDGTFVRDGGSIKMKLDASSIVSFRIVPDYPPTCTTPEQAKELDKAKAAEAPKKPSKFVQRILDNTTPKR